MALLAEIRLRTCMRHSASRPIHTTDADFLGVWIHFAESLTMTWAIICYKGKSNFKATKTRKVRWQLLFVQVFKLMLLQIHKVIHHSHLSGSSFYKLHRVKNWELLNKLQLDISNAPMFFPTSVYRTFSPYRHCSTFQNSLVPLHGREFCAIIRGHLL